MRWNRRLAPIGDKDLILAPLVRIGERFVHMIETFYGLARLGHTDRTGMPYPLQLALSAQEFSDAIVFRSPPLAVQRVIFGALARSRTGAAIARRTRSSRASCCRLGCRRRTAERQRLQPILPKRPLSRLTRQGSGIRMGPHYGPATGKPEAIGIECSGPKSERHIAERSMAKQTGTIVA